MTRMPRAAHTSGKGGVHRDSEGRTREPESVAACAISAMPSTAHVLVALYTAYVFTVR